MTDKLKKLIFITGRPGIGKTTVLLRVVGVLKIKGYRIGGMVSREVRERGSRVGFELVDVYTKRKGWLAHVNRSIGPKVGKYRVNLEDLEKVGVKAILHAVKNVDVVVVDEIGPMELHSSPFKKAVIQAFESGKPLLGTIHRYARDPLIHTIRTREDTEILEVTYENREKLHKTVIDKILKCLQMLS
ncbi:MAG: NTPase [Thermoproteota archaeon]|nr:NTPase [Thermoproteota archaeon]